MVLTWPEGNVLRELTRQGSLRPKSSGISFLGKSMVGEEITSGSKACSACASRSRANPARAHRRQDGPASDSLQPLCHSEAPRPSRGSRRQPLILLQEFRRLVPTGQCQRPAPTVAQPRRSSPSRGWPKLRMDRSHIEFRGSEVDIIGMRLMHETDNRGIIELDGTVSPYAADRPSALAVQLDSFLMSGIAGAEIGAARFRPDQHRADAEVQFPLVHLRLRARHHPGSYFPQPVFLADRDPWFPIPRVISHGSWRTTGSNVRSSKSKPRGALPRTGRHRDPQDLDLKTKAAWPCAATSPSPPDRQLSGELRIGIAEAMIKTSPEPTPRCAVRTCRGRVPLVHPQDRRHSHGADGQFQRASTKPPQPKAGKPAAASSGRPSFEDLTAPK